MAQREVATLAPVEPPARIGEALDTTSLAPSEQDTSRFLIQSPYTEIEHQLDLDTVDHENELLARALVNLRNTRDDYATAPYVESFNWTDILTEVQRLARASPKPFHRSSFYIVAFRSQIKPSTDYSHLGDLDKGAHREAVESGGFLKYWFGAPDSELRNLATCVWRSREDAIIGGRGPAHKKAAGSTRALYAYWKIDQHRLTIHENAESWDIVPWSE